MPNLRVTDTFVLSLKGCGLYYTDTTEGQIEDLLRTAIFCHNMYFIDTAPQYGAGRNEIDFGESLAKFVQEGSQKEYLKSHGVTVTEDTPTKMIMMECPSYMMDASSSTLRHLLIVPDKYIEDPERKTIEMPIETLECEKDSLHIFANCGRITVTNNIWKQIEDQSSDARSNSDASILSTQRFEQLYSYENKEMTFASTPEYISQVISTYEPDYKTNIRERIDVQIVKQDCSIQLLNYAKRLAEKSGMKTSSKKGFISGEALNTYIADGAEILINDINAGKVKLPADVVRKQASTCVTIGKHKEIEINRVNGNMYLHCEKTKHFVTIMDCSYRGTLLSFAQSYERIFGPLHKMLGERIVMSKDGFISIKKKKTVNGSFSVSLKGHWFVISTIHIQNADSPELRNIATGSAKMIEHVHRGAYAALSELKVRKYINYIGVSSSNSDAVKTHITWANYQTRIPLRIQSVQLNGCWTILRCEENVHALFRTIIRSNDRSDYIHFEFINEGIFGDGLLWGKDIYRTEIANEEEVRRREALNEIVKAVLGTDIQTKNSPYQALAAVALKFAMKSTSTQPPSEVVPYAVANFHTRICIACSNVQELNKFYDAVDAMPTDKQMAEILSRWRLLEKNVEDINPLEQSNIMYNPVNV